MDLVAFCTDSRSLAAHSEGQLAGPGEGGGQYDVIFKKKFLNVNIRPGRCLYSGHLNTKNRHNITSQLSLAVTDVHIKASFPPFAQGTSRSSKCVCSRSPDMVAEE